MESVVTNNAKAAPRRVDIAVVAFTAIVFLVFGVLFGSAVSSAPATPSTPERLTVYLGPGHYRASVLKDLAFTSHLSPLTVIGSGQDRTIFIGEMEVPSDTTIRNSRFFGSGKFVKVDGDCKNAKFENCTFTSAED